MRQACRLPYDLVVDGKREDLGDKAYLLCPQDLAAYDLVGDLAALGVASFKIEGRLKSPHYVAATTQTYRAAPSTRLSPNADFAIAEQQRADLEQTFSRGFTHGFLAGVNHQELVAARFPKARGRRIGTVARMTPQRRSSIALARQSHASASPLKPGDGVVFDEGHPEQDEQGGRVLDRHAARQARDRARIRPRRREPRRRSPSARSSGRPTTPRCASGWSTPSPATPSPAARRSTRTSARTSASR